MSTYLFRTPIRTQGPRVPSIPNPPTAFDQGGRAGFPLMRHINRGNGIPVAVLIVDGAVVEKSRPTTLDMQAADATYMGGRDNIITNNTFASLLIAAGYDLINLAPGGYGIGGYGEGGYGL